MAAAALPSVDYKFPGGADLENPDFHSMCDWYMNSYFSDFVNDSCPRSVHLVPPLPLKIAPEPPESSSGGAKSSLLTKVSKKQYDNFRTGQKSSIDEYNLVKWIQKHATESQTPMFIFHGFKIDRKKWKFIQSIADSELRSEDSLRELEKLLKEENWLDDKGDPKEIEIDVVTVDPTNGVVIWEVKSRNSEVKASSSVQNKKLKSAGKQLQRDVAIISWLSKSFASENISTSIKKVVVLPDDQITAEDDAKFEKKRDYAILDSILLSELQNFSRWFHTEITGNDKSDQALKHSIYRKLVPVMVGLAATVVTLTRDKSLKVSEDEEGVSSAAATARLDSEIDQQKLTRQNKQFTDVLSTNEETNLRSLKGLEIMFLTPQQRPVLDCSSNGLKILQGHAGSGKTILTIFKVLELCAREPKKQILIFCNSKSDGKYFDILTKNGVEAKTVSSKQAEELDFTELGSLQGFKEPECQVLIFNEMLFTYIHSSDKNSMWQKKGEKPIRRQNTHIFVDDCHLYEIRELFSRMESADDKQCLTWAALDQHQCFYSGSFVKNDEWFKRLDISIESNVIEVFKLDEVIRSTVEIQQFNASLVSQIASCALSDSPPEVAQTRSRMHLENFFISFTKPQQGSNFHGPPVQVYELYEPGTMNYESSNAKIHRKRYANFTAFIFGTIIESGALINKVPIISSIFSRHNEMLEALIEVGHTPINLYDKLSKREHFTSAALVEESEDVKSFEWERVLVVPDLGLCGVPADKDDAFYRALLVLLYQGCTRARSQLYIVAPGMFWELIMSRLGVPENCVIVRKYRLDQSESTFEEDSNLKYTEEEIQKLNQLMGFEDIP